MYANLARHCNSLLIVLLTVFSLCLSKVASAQDSPELPGFSSVWKLMTAADRERFISGYLRGWKDASQFLDVALEYVRTNPELAAYSLVKLRKLANLGDQKPDALAVFIDQYYKNPANQAAPLSRAVTAAQAAGVGTENIEAAP